ncbi:unnamed protein product [Amoebophrya sp. A25]|nr:unnamed protein product [Amoebophrya sp. A25]|eukprot:GSA25T00015382001.1
MTNLTSPSSPVLEDGTPRIEEVSEDAAVGRTVKNDEETLGKTVPASALLGDVKDNPEWVLAEELPAAMDKYEGLWTTEDPEDDPYKSKYAGRKVLEEVLEKLESHVFTKKALKVAETLEERGGSGGASGGSTGVAGLLNDQNALEAMVLEQQGGSSGSTSTSSGPIPTGNSMIVNAPGGRSNPLRQRLRENIADLYRLLGKNYYFCEEVPAGEARLVRALYEYIGLENRTAILPRLQETLNQLGMIWVQRGNCSKALDFLRRAQVLYHRKPAKMPGNSEEHCDNYYTLTQFYLAQAYGAMQNSGLSAKYCCETLSRQLQYNTRKKKKKAGASSGTSKDDGTNAKDDKAEQSQSPTNKAEGVQEEEKEIEDPFDVRDWARNCIGLAEYFSAKCMFWTAEYVLFAALVLLTDTEVSLDGVTKVRDTLHDPDEMIAEIRKNLGSVYSGRLQFSKTCAELTEEKEIIKAWEDFAKEHEEALVHISGAGEEDAPPVIQGGSSPSSKAATATKGSQPTGERLEFDKMHWPYGNAYPRTLDDATLLFDEKFPATVSVADAEVNDGRRAAEKLLSEAEAQDLIAEQEAENVRQLRTAVLRLSSSADAKAADAKAHFLQVAVFFPKLHKRIEHKMNAMDREFFKVRETGYKITTNVALAAGPRYEESKELFKVSNHFFTQALDFYKLDGWCTDHLKVLQEISNLYRHLSSWETDAGRKSAMYVRRHKMLSPLLDQLSKHHFRNYWRQISYECGEIYHDLADLAEANFHKKKDLKSGQKVNSHIVASRNFFKMFTDTYDTDERGDVHKLEPADGRAYAHAKINAARMGSKFVGMDKKAHVEMLKSVIDEYNGISRWLDKVEKKQDLGLEAEEALVREMCSLLPAQLERVLRAPS